MDFYVLRGKKAIKTDVLDWSTSFEIGDRRVAQTSLPDDVEVSTVFLGMDHQFGDGPPLLFETMVFGGEQDQETMRYTTWEEAAKGHKDMVAFVRRSKLKVVNGKKE